jgi:hypothetical protein
VLVASLTGDQLAAKTAQAECLAAEAAGGHLPAALAKGLLAGATSQHVRAPTASAVADITGLHCGAPSAEALKARVAEGGLVTLTEQLPTLVTQGVIVLLMRSAAKPVQTSQSAAVGKGLLPGEKWLEWPRGVHTTRQLALTNKNFLAARLCALKAGRDLTASKRAHHCISRDATAGS